DVGDDAGLQRDRRNPRAAPDRRLLDFVAQIGHGPERHRLPALPGQLQIPERIDRAALDRGSPSRDIDEIDAGASLWGRGALEHRGPWRGNVFGRTAELARLVLESVDLDDTRRLHPVERDVAEIGAAPDDTGECLRELPDLRDGRPAQAVLHGTSYRRADLEQLDVGVGAGERLPQIFLELRLDEVARLYAALGHNHLL